MKKISISFGKYNVELKAFKIISGHDDTLPFTANMYANNIKIAECMNDGWGADAMVYPYDKNIELFNEVKKIVCETMYDGFKCSMPYLADVLAAKMADQQTISKLFKNKLVFQKGDNIFSVGINNSKGEEQKIATLMSSLNGINAITRTINKYMNQGYVCLNDNVCLNN